MPEIFPLSSGRSVYLAPPRGKALIVHNIGPGRLHYTDKTFNDEGETPEHTRDKVIEAKEAKEFKRHVWITGDNTRAMVERP